MTLLSAGALTGLVLLVPLVVAHLRRPARADYDVPSLLLWDDLEREAIPRARRLRLPWLPLLLLLQALALVLLVVALARPAASAKPPAPTHVYVLDDSLWMGVTGRFPAAEERIRELATRLPRRAPVLLVLADGSPHVIYRGPAGRVNSGLAGIAPGVAPPSLAQALSLVAGRLASPDDRVVVIRAPEDELPALRAAPGELQTVVIGDSAADQGISSPSARCGTGAAGGCEVLATVSSTAKQGVTDRYTAYADGQPLTSGLVRLGAHSSAEIAFSAPAGVQIHVRLAVRDALGADDQAWVSVPRRPGAPRATIVTLVGAPSTAQPVARAFAAVPGVTVRLRTPADYRPADARGADLTVVDGALPASGLPSSPAVALIDPTSLPGGAVGRPLAETTVSGEDATSSLVNGVDLSSLVIASRAARAVALPGYLTAVVWSADGPLLAAGDDGSRRVAVMSFDPARSDLPQLDAFPILASNLVQWASGWVSSSAPAGEPLRVDATPGATEVSLALNGAVVARKTLRGEAVELPVSRSGVYTVTETGPGIDRRATVSASVAAGSASAGPVARADAPVDLTATRIESAPGHGPTRAPWLLGAAVAVLLLEWAYWRTRPQATGVMSSPRRRLWSTLEGGALALLVVALVLPEWGAPRPQTVLVLDRSASIDARMRATEDAWVRSARKSCPQPCRVVQFAAATQPLPATTAALTLHTPAPTVAGATDIASGVDTALGLLPHGGRAIVLSDGLQTTGDAAAAAANARAAHVELDYVRLSDPTLRDAAVTAIHAPSSLHAGDPLPLEITVRSTVTARATLSVARDGVTIGSQRVNLRTGDNPFLLSYTAGAAGWHSFEARIALSSDGLSVDDTLATTVDVVQAPRVLEVAPRSEASGAAVASVLRRDGLAVTRVEPARSPAAAATLAGLDAVVLDDVPAGALDRGQVGALTHAVDTGGLGLLVLGGPHSFSLGGYAHTGLEQLLPVSSLVPGDLQRGNVAIELVLDHSGSMIDLLGGIPKIDAVRVAGTQVTRYIGAHRDDLGIVDFDIAPHVLVPMQSIDSAAAQRTVLGKVDSLQANGGTNIYAALSAGLRQLEQSHAPHKHLILMTDGISEPENYAPLLATLDHDHIQVASVALGRDADKALLRHIASATGGRFYYVANAHSLPTIFYDETQFSVQPVKVTGHVTVTGGADSPVIRSLAGSALPALTGNVITTLKPGAQTDLLARASGSRESPALAQWQDGAGRVVAFTAGVGAPFAASWRRELQLWDDAVRWVERGAPPTRLTPTVIPGAPPTLEIDLAGGGVDAFGVSAIEGSLQSRAGISYPIELARVSPSLYQAALPGIPTGVYSFHFAAAGAASTGLVAVPYSFEYLPRPPTDTSLGPLAALTGGHALNPSQPEWLSSGAPTTLWWPLALAALVLFLATALGRQLEPTPREGYAATSPASRAVLESRSSTATSVGASR